MVGPNPSVGSDRARPTVTVQGDSVVRVEPDEAILWITLSALEDSPGPALADVAARSAALAALLDESAVTQADRSTTGVSVCEEVDHTSRGRRSLGHRAVASVQVRFTDAETIGPVISRATQELQARVDGPHWYISMDNPARLQAAKLAAINAREKAAAYASGVDAQLGQLIQLSEPNAGFRGHQAYRTSGPTVAFAASGSGDMPIETGEHEIAAAVEATFILDQR